MDPRDATSQTGSQWLGQLVNGTYRLSRHLGSTDHSELFLAESGTAERPTVAIKLVFATPNGAQAQLANWRAAAALTHPHLMPLLETGRCQLGQRPYLYAVMDYADQNLAQLLTQRPLTEDEAREMLLPALGALEFLHGRKLVHGAVKPANILAVGDELKLSSDTVRPVDDAGIGQRSPGIYDPPEARDGIYSAAGDVWGLGITLVEALTRSSPSTANERGRGVLLPRDIPPTFREVVSWCLSPRPTDRPKASELEAWIRHPTAGPSPRSMPRPAAGAQPIERPPAPRPAVSSQPVVRTAVSPAAKVARPDGAPRGASAGTARAAAGAVAQRAAPARLRALTRSSALPLILGALGLLLVGWIGLRIFGPHRTAAVVATTEEASHESPDAAAASGANGTSAPTLSAPNPKVPATDRVSSASGVHEEIPEVPRHVRQTIHGHVKVSVRVIVDKEGAVVAALVDDPGPSRYFERLASEAARKWTFPPTDTQGQRLKLVRFEFSRDGTRGQAVSLE